MKKSAKLIEQERIRDLQYGPIYMLQKQILIDKLQSLMEKKHVDKSQEDQVLQMINVKLSELQSKSHIDSLIRLDQLLEDCLWSYEFHENFLKQVLKMNQYMDILIFVYLILEGYFDKKFDTFETILIDQQNPKLLTNYFIFKSNHIKVSILYEVGLCKYPIIEGYKQLKGFEVRHQITFIDIKQLDYTHQLQQSLMHYIQQISTNPHRQELPFIYQEQQFLQNNQQVGPQEAFLYDFKEECWGDLQFNVKKNKIYRWVPCQLPNFGGNMDNFILQEDGLYVTERWLETHEAIETYKQIQLSNSAMMQRYADFKQAVNIIDFLQISADFKIKATEQEKQVISSPGNLMVIGRSGTGKTTCAILRLFSIHILLKYKVQLHNQKSNKLFHHSQIDNKQIGLHCLFTTQNQMLVDEVKKIYQRMLKELQQASLESNQSLNQSMATDTQSEYDQEDEEIEQNKLSNMILDELAQEMRQDGYEIEKEVNRFTDYEDSDFPLFLSIKKLLFSIDNCLEYPYFQQERFLDVDNIGGDQAGWDDENGRNNIKQEIKQQQNKDLDILEQNAIKEFQFGFLDQQLSITEEKIQQKDNNEQQTAKFRNIRVVEVNYDIFKNQFWPEVKTNLKQKREDDAVQCLVWTQIYSYIKGSQYSHQYPGNYLPKELYMKNLQAVISNDKLEEIYYVFQQYERWKEYKNYYDQMDLVNYLINSIDKNEYYCNPIHYTLIDEVQDLPHSTIKLIKKLTEQSIYCSGDTAQNISKGVGFRFQDLRSLLLPTDDIDSINNQEFQCHQLTVNFRSHNNILQLANSLVNIMEIFFPKTIDKLKREISDLQGPIPFIVQSNNKEDLFKYLNLLGMKLVQDEVDQNLGYDKVVIVKDQESKANLPEELSKNFICLTISQCKGLEFNDVIIWNFFCDQTISLEQWQLLGKLTIDSTFEDADVHEAKITNQLNDQKSKSQNQKVQVKKLKLTNNIEFDQFQYSSLCLELKQLYVAITRARQRILIFDLESSRRQPIQTIWQNLGVIKYLQNFIVQDIDKMACKELIQNQKNSRDGWMEQGFRMFQNKYYQEAYKCFKFAGDGKWQLKCQAYIFAQDAQKLKNEIKSLDSQINQGQLNEKETRQAKEQTKIYKIKSNDLFKKAGSIFKSHNQLFQAAQCYFSCEEYDTSMDLFLQKGLFLEAADCAHKLKKNYHLSILLLKENYFEKALDCLEKLKEYNVMILIVQKFKKFFSEQTYDNYLDQLVPQILGQMWNSYKGNQIQSYVYLEAFKQLSKYSYKFEEEKQLFDQGQFFPTTESHLLDRAYQIIKLSIKNIIQRLQRSFINFDVDKLLIELKNQEINEFKISFIIDVLEQYELFDFKDFLIEYAFKNNETQQDQQILQKVFQYSGFINNQKQVKIHNSNRLEMYLYHYRVDENIYNNFIGILCSFGFKSQALLYANMHQYEIPYLKELSLRLRQFFHIGYLNQTFRDLRQRVDQERAISSIRFHQKNLFQFQIKKLNQCQLEYYVKLDHLIHILKVFFQQQNKKSIRQYSNEALNIIFQIEDMEEEMKMNVPIIFANIALYEFFRIIKFMWFLCSIFKKNGQIHIQMQIFKDLCIYHKILIPVFSGFKIFEIFSCQYLWVSKDSDLIKQSDKLKDFQKFQCDQDYYLISTTHILKIIQRQNKKRVEILCNSYFQSYLDQDRYLKRCPIIVKLFLFIQTKIQSKEYIFHNSKLFEQIAEEENYKVLEGCLRKQFEIQLSKPHFYLDISDDFLEENYHVELLKVIDAISIQYLMKAIGTDNLSKKIKYIKQAFQINSIKNQQNYNFILIFVTLNEKFQLNLIEKQISHIFYYNGFINKIRQKICVDAIKYFTDSYEDYFDKNNFKRDVQLAGIVAILTIPLIEKDRIKYGAQSQKVYLNQEQYHILQSAFVQKDEIILQINEEYLRKDFLRFIKFLFNQDKFDQMSLMYVINQNIKYTKLKDKILDCLDDSRLNHHDRNKIYEIFNSSKKNKQQAYKLTYIIEEDDQKILHYDQIKKAFIPQEQLENIFEKCKKSLADIHKSRIQSPSLALIIQSYYSEERTFSKVIFEQFFLDCFDLIEQMRIKLFQFLFKYSDDSLKFRSALETLTKLKDYQDQLFLCTPEEKQNRSQNQYQLQISSNQGMQLNEKQSQLLFKNIQTLYKQINDWEARNQNYQNANKLIDREYELDEQIIKRRKRQQFQIDLSEIQKSTIIKQSEELEKDFYFQKPNDKYYQNYRDDNQWKGNNQFQNKKYY